MTIGLCHEIPRELPAEDFPNLLFPNLTGAWVNLARALLNRKTGAAFYKLTQASFLGFERFLAQRLEQVALPSLLCEFRGLQSSLPGQDDREKRFHFVEKMFGTSQNRTMFYQKYPVLDHLLNKLISQHVANTALFLERLERDKKEMRFRFWETDSTADSEAPLHLDITAGLSDPHNGGQTVCRIVFEDKTILYYKPKDLTIVREYNQLINRLNGWGLEPSLPAYKILNRSRYGWVQSIDSQPCQDEKQVERFYLRSGMNLCLMHWLQGTDMHLENVIACREFPFFVDLETLFDNTRNIAGVKDPMLLSGLEQTLMLPYQPRRIFGQKAKDMGSLTSLISIHLPNFHLCKLGSEFTRAQGFVKFVSRGFRIAYQFLVDHREALMKADGQLAKLARCPVRIVLRHTGLYGRMLRQLCGPEFMADKHKRDRHMDYLLGVAIKNRPELDVILPWEKASFSRHDVPFFTCYPNQRHLYLDGELIGENFFNRSSFSQVKKRFLGFGQADCRRQDGDLRVALRYGGDTDLHYPGNPVRMSFPKEANPENYLVGLLNLAVEIGQELESRILVDHNGYVHWRDLNTHTYQKRAFLGFTGDSLHSGCCGVGVYFSTLYGETGNSCWETLAERSINRVKVRLEGGQAQMLVRESGVGAAAGLGGMVYALAVVGDVTGNHALLDLAMRSALHIEKKALEQSPVQDVFGGTAGWLLVLLKLFQLTGEEKLLTAARDCGDLLMSKKVGVDVTPGGEVKQGFAFGDIGIGFSLLKLGVETEGSDYVKAGERLLMESSRGFDLNKGEEAPASSWCRGGYGSALVLLRAGKLLVKGGFENPWKGQMQNHALSLTSAQITDLDHLCCGNFGRLACLLAISRETGDQKLKTFAHSLACHLTKGYQGTGGRFLGQYSGSYWRPGLFSGVSGMGQLFLFLTRDTSNLDFLTFE